VTSRRFALWQKVVALAPLLLVAVYLPGEMMLRCRIDGLLRPACCCPAQEAQAPQDTGPTVEAQDCCDREITGSARPVVEAARRAEPGLLPAIALRPSVTTAVADLPAGDRFTPAAQRYGPAREGPPLVLLKHAFLI
jgi:hypothetical protein